MKSYARRFIDKVRRLTWNVSGAKHPIVAAPDPAARIANANDLIKAAPDLAALIRQHGMREGNWVAPAFFRAMQKEGYSILANTFYSIVPDVNAISDQEWNGQKYKNAFSRCRWHGIDNLISDIHDFVAELSDVPFDAPAVEGEFFWSNSMFPPLDAVAYYGMVRKLKPRRIIEVGSGYSTAIALMAARKNGDTKITCIEPYPSSFLQKQSDHLESIIQMKVEDVPRMTFEMLDPGDFLFIDSSHCCRIGSDLNYILFDILPILKEGVFVHFHDIFLPYEYPETWLKDIGIMWNEQYLLLAFLMYNDIYKIVWSSRQGGQLYAQDLSDIFARGTQLPNTHNPLNGASLWLCKVES